MKKIVFRYPFILLFGIFQIFFSGPGQTFLISLFVTPIFNELSASRSLFAGLYSAATLSASLLLNPAGRLIDKYPVHRIITGITCLMALGCLILAGSQNLIMLFLGFFIVRLIGQGVFGLTASTLIAKKFEKNRGKAMGIITLGFPLSEAIYPSIALFLLSLLGWRISYLIFGASNILIMLPLQLFLVHKSNITRGQFLPGEALINPQRLRGNPDDRKIKPHKNFTLKRVLKDIKFYPILIASCVPPTVMTGILFHQETLFKANHWPISLAAAGLGAYALFKAIGAIGIGSIVDKYGPLAPFVILILMLGVGTYLAAMGGPTYRIYAYFSLLGAALGISSPVMNVVWPNFYGIKYLGSIKGFVGTVRNGLTSLGPLPIALALDMGVSINVILKWIALGICLIASLPIIVWWMENKIRQS